MAIHLSKASVTNRQFLARFLQNKVKIVQIGTWREAPRIYNMLIN